MELPEPFLVRQFLGPFSFQKLLVLLRQKKTLSLLLLLEFDLALKIFELLLSSQPGCFLVTLGQWEGLGINHRKWWKLPQRQ